MRLIFLIEGAVLGLAGGLFGLVLAFLASYPGDAIAKSIMEPQTQTPVKGSLFVYPLWLILGAPALAGLITTLAAVYPAHRAPRSTRLPRCGMNDLRRDLRVIAPSGYRGRRPLALVSLV